MNKNLPTAVYRLYDRAGVLLYVGMSIKPHERVRQHSAREWYPDIDHARTTVEWRSDQASAHEAEKTAIRNEVPLHNRERYLPTPARILRPINLYRTESDRPVWDRTRQDAKAAGLSLSAYVVIVLREHQKRAARQAATSSEATR